MSFGLSQRVTLGMILLLTGCRHPPQLQGPGTSSFAFVDPAPTPSHEPGGSDDGLLPWQRTQYVEASLIDPHAMPIYPPRLLSARLGKSIVGVHITVDTSGRVSDIRPSFLVVSTPGPFADDFRTAAETAVTQWRFVPAALQQMKLVDENGMVFARPAHTQNVEAEFDAAFTFLPNGGVEQKAVGK